MNENENLETQEEVTQEVTEPESTGTDETLAAGENPGETVEEVLEETATETLEVLEVTTDRPFLSTPIDDYTVTEGLLLLILVLLVVSKIGQAIKEGFYWLL